MLSYTHVEDYLELLGGYNLGDPDLEVNIKLARYDISVVNNMSWAIHNGEALTDRQAELTVKLILKYQKQFAKHNIDITPVIDPVYRQPLRKVDRDHKVDIEDKKLVIKFPYDKELINDLTYYRESSQGRMYFDKEFKKWKIALTEKNVLWVTEWAKNLEFDISSCVKELYSKLINEKKKHWSIELVNKGECYAINNAPESLINYVNEHLGGFSKDNWLKLIDYSGILGYEINDMVFQDKTIAISSEMRTALEYIGSKRNVHVHPNDVMLKWIFDYVRLTDRYPVCIYDPDGKLDLNFEEFDKSKIVRFDKNAKTKSCNYDPYNVKIIYAKKIPKTWEFPVPILITTFEMMFGGSKTIWTTKAEKIIYYCETKLKEI